MTDKINGRTPEEIKRGLECDETGDCLTFSCPYYHSRDCLRSRLIDFDALIQQLESERDQYKREMDAAVADMTELMQLAQFCRHCKHITSDGECTFDFAANKGEPWCWQWRGVPQEVE